MNTPEFMDAVMAKLDLPSDRKFGEALDIPNGMVSRYRNGLRKLNPKDCDKVAAALGLPSAYVKAMVQAERAERKEDRADWEWLAALAKKSKAAAAVVLVAMGGLLGQPVDANALSQPTAPMYHSVYYGKWRRLIRYLLGIPNGAGA